MTMANLNPITRNKKDNWTEKDIEKLQKLYPVKSNEDVAAALGKPASAIRAKAYKLRLKKDSRYWTPKESKWLKKNWDVMSAEELATKLNKTKWAIINKYRELTGKRKGHKELNL